VPYVSMRYENHGRTHQYGADTSFIHIVYRIGKIKGNKPVPYVVKYLTVKNSGYKLPYTIYSKLHRIR